METRGLNIKPPLGKQAIRKERRRQVLNQRLLSNLFKYSAIALRMSVRVTNAEASAPALWWLEIKREVVVI